MPSTLARRLHAHSIRADWSPSAARPSRAALPLVRTGKLLPRTDFFHSTSALTLVPLAAVPIPSLCAEIVMHYLGSDIRASRRPSSRLEEGARSRRLVAQSGCPGRDYPAGIDVAAIELIRRPIEPTHVLHAPSSRRRKEGARHCGVRWYRRRSRPRRGLHTRGLRSVPVGRHRLRPVKRLVRSSSQSSARGVARRDVPTTRRSDEKELGTRCRSFARRRRTLVRARAARARHQRQRMAPSHALRGEMHDLDAGRPLSSHARLYGARPGSSGSESTRLSTGSAGSCRGSSPSSSSRSTRDTSRRPTTGRSRRHALTTFLGISLREASTRGLSSTSTPRSRQRAACPSHVLWFTMPRAAGLNAVSHSRPELGSPLGTRPLELACGFRRTVVGG